MDYFFLKYKRLFKVFGLSFNIPCIICLYLLVFSSHIWANNPIFHIHKLKTINHIEVDINIPVILDDARDFAIKNNLDIRVVKQEIARSNSGACGHTGIGCLLIAPIVLKELANDEREYHDVKMYYQGKLILHAGYGLNNQRILWATITLNNTQQKYRMLSLPFLEKNILDNVTQKNNSIIYNSRFVEWYKKKYQEEGSEAAKQGLVHEFFSLYRHVHPYAQEVFNQPQYSNTLKADLVFELCKKKHADPDNRLLDSSLSFEQWLDMAAQNSSILVTDAVIRCLIVHDKKPENSLPFAVQSINNRMKQLCSSPIDTFSSDLSNQYDRVNELFQLSYGYNLYKRMKFSDIFLPEQFNIRPWVLDTIKENLNECENPAWRVFFQLLTGQEVQVSVIVQFYKRYGNNNELEQVLLANLIQNRVTYTNFIFFKLQEQPGQSIKFLESLYETRHKQLELIPGQVKFLIRLYYQDIYPNETNFYKTKDMDYIKCAYILGILSRVNIKNKSPLLAYLKKQNRQKLTDDLPYYLLGDSTKLDYILTGLKDLEPDDFLYKYIEHPKAVSTGESLLQYSNPEQELILFALYHYGFSINEIEALHKKVYFEHIKKSNKSSILFDKEKLKNWLKEKL